MPSACCLFSVSPRLPPHPFLPFCRAYCCNTHSLKGLEKHNLSFFFPLNGCLKNPYKICVCCYHTLGSLRRICNVRKQMGVSGWKGKWVQQGSARKAAGMPHLSHLMGEQTHSPSPLPFSHFLLSLQDKLLERSP